MQVTELEQHNIILYGTTNIGRGVTKEGLTYHNVYHTFAKYFGLNFLLRSNVYLNMRPCVAALEKCSSNVWFMSSLVPRLFEEEEEGPGTHCVRMRKHEP